MVKIVIESERFDALQKHLFPEDFAGERAAFLFAKTVSDGRTVQFDAVEHLLVDESGVRYSSLGYLELTDETRGRVIKRAHDLETSLVEIHSHRLPFPAEFSPTDIDGLREFVPHVWWRLRGRPYLAVVAAPESFDGLAWIHDAESAECLDELMIGDRVMQTTGRSMKGWYKEYGESI
jgi:hypothetical protein